MIKVMPPKETCPVLRTKGGKTLKGKIFPD